MYVMWSIEKRPRDLKKQKIFTCLDFGDCRRPICIFSTASQSCSTFSNEQFRFLRHRNHNKKRRAYNTLGVEIQRKVCYLCIYYLPIILEWLFQNLINLNQISLYVHKCKYLDSIVLTKLTKIVQKLLKIGVENFF